MRCNWPSRPVFLLYRYRAFLMVMTNRLGRVIDRARILEERLERAGAGIRRNATRRSRRAVTTGQTQRPRDHVLYGDSAPRLHDDRGAVRERLFGFEASIPVAVFIRRGDVVFLSRLLLWFLREIYLATKSLRIGPH
jgi:hypothetical protein